MCIVWLISCYFGVLGAMLSSASIAISRYTPVSYLAPAEEELTVPIKNAVTKRIEYKQHYHLQQQAIGSTNQSRKDADADGHAAAQTEGRRAAVEGNSSSSSDKQRVQCDAWGLTPVTEAPSTKKS